MDGTPEETESAAQHDDELAPVRAWAQRALEDLRPFLRPSTAAEIAERLWEFSARMEELAECTQPPAVPVVARPRHLPRPLNPLYFQRARGARPRGGPPS